MIWYHPKNMQKTTAWSGGTTTQLMIWPLDASYGDRNFDFRFSTATVEVEESLFSDLTGYNRYLMTLDSPLTVWEDDFPPFKLLPLSLYTFSGAAKVRTHGKATDYNLMVKPTFSAQLNVLQLTPGENLAKLTNDLGIFCLSGSSTIKSEKSTYTLAAGDFIFISRDEPMEMTATTDATLIISTFQSLIE